VRHTGAATGPTPPIPIFENMSEAPPAPRTAGQMIVGYFKDFGVLRETRREYWGIQIINFLDCTFYFAMLTIAAVFLSDDLGLSDVQAGFTITVFTSATTLMLFLSGMYTDWLGIRKSMNISMIALFLLRSAMVAVALVPGLPHRGILAGVLFFLMAPFMAAVQTNFQAACQRYTTRRSRSAGFNLWYLFMNVGAAAGGFMIDVVRRLLHLPNVHIFTMGVVTALLCYVTCLVLVRREEQLIGPDESPEAGKTEAVVERKRPLQIIKSVIHEPAFWRLLVLIALILGVRAVYAYMYLLMPKYWLRTIGPDAAIGTLNAINPIGIVIGLILFIPITNKFKVFNMLVYGSMFSALALFPMAVVWQVYVGPTDAFHHGLTGLFRFLGSLFNSPAIANANFWWTFGGSSIVNAHYAMAILCMILITIGEVVWSPKLNEYTAAIAPKGQEGTYLGLSLIPWFLAKTVVSALSGFMLARWSPEKVPVHGVEVPLQQALQLHQVPYWHSPSAMWLILGTYAMAGCIGAALLSKWLTKGARWKIEPHAA
jgi:MFS family permease